MNGDTTEPAPRTRWWTFPVVYSLTFVVLGLAGNRPWLAVGGLLGAIATSPLHWLRSRREGADMSQAARDEELRPPNRPLSRPD